MYVNTLITADNEILGQSGQSHMTYKVGCVFPMVAVSILLHAKFGGNYHRKTHPTLLFSPYNMGHIIFIGTEKLEKGLARSVIVYDS